MDHKYLLYLSLVSGESLKNKKQRKCIENPLFFQYIVHLFSTKKWGILANKDVIYLEQNKKLY